MNNRTEAKLTDLSGMQKTIEETLKQAWERGREYQQRLDSVGDSEWILDSDNLPICEACGEIALQRIFVKGPDMIQEVRMIKSNFCPNCGAKMRKGR